MTTFRARFTSPLAAVVATAMVFTGAMWVQRARDAWPFEPAVQAATPQAIAMTGAAADPATTHSRVAIDVTASTVQQLGIRLETVA
ncbi:MAG TPA: hypothetical protein VIZ32_19360, partial [Vicinamibacterales bacterium]